MLGKAISFPFWIVVAALTTIGLLVINFFYLLLYFETKKNNNLSELYSEIWKGLTFKTKLSDIWK